MKYLLIVLRETKLKWLLQAEHSYIKTSKKFILKANLKQSEITSVAILSEVVVDMRGMRAMSCFLARDSKFKHTIRLWWFPDVICTFSSGKGGLAGKQASKYYPR